MKSRLKFQPNKSPKPFFGSSLPWSFARRVVLPLKEKGQDCFSFLGCICTLIPNSFIHCILRLCTFISKNMKTYKNQNTLYDVLMTAYVLRGHWCCKVLFELTKMHIFSVLNCDSWRHDIGLTQEKSIFALFRNFSLKKTITLNSYWMYVGRKVSSIE